MFIQVIEGRTSNPEGLHERIEVWERELRPDAPGYLGSAGGCTNDGSFVLIARFEDADAARRNSQRPEQDEWWRETEKLLEGPVTFHDTEDVQVMSHGRLEDAHFIQVMDGHVTDRARADRLEQEADEVLAEMRPDLLGSITAYYGDGEFTDVAYFTTEEEAREAEQREQPPEFQERFAEFQDVMHVDRYLDITDPWLTEAR